MATTIIDSFTLVNLHRQYLIILLYRILIKMFLVRPFVRSVRVSNSKHVEKLRQASQVIRQITLNKKDQLTQMERATAVHV